MAHIPVLLKEVLEFLPPGDRFIDGTAGDGGYIKSILAKRPSSKVLGIDLDQTSLDKLKNELVAGNLHQRCILVQGNYKNVKYISQEENFQPVAGVILDLGFSSTQLDDPARGLSFQQDGPLDMRFDPSQKKTAEEIVSQYSPEALAKIFRDYGEEKHGFKIALGIVRARQKEKIRSTKKLFELIQETLPKPVVYKAADYARRIFQALRIEVNDELNNLKKVLPDILEILAPGGRMLVISFHSLEDRIVKEFIVEAAKGCICPPDFPQCVCGKNPLLKIISKKPIRATTEEISENPRSKPAKLRVAQKV